MLTNILYVLLAIVILGLIVTVHEFGHYLVGRLCGIGIIEFSVGFGPKLIGWEKKDIKYSIRCIPLGGYCAFVGEDETNDDPRAMNNQPVWKRFLTVLAGPFMNFVLAFVCCALMLGNFMVAESFPARRHHRTDQRQRHREQRAGRQRDRHCHPRRGAGQHRPSHRGARRSASAPGHGHHRRD